MNFFGVRSLFDIPEDVTYFNCASLSPQLLSVTREGIKNLQKKAAPWRIQAEDWFSGAEELRKQAARIINANDDDIAIIPSVSYGIGIASNNLPVKEGQEILVMDEEYPSNYYAWQELAIRSRAKVTIVKKDDSSWTQALLKAIDDRTAVIAIANCHWTNGAMVDLSQISIKARSVGAALVIDASQAMGARPIDVTLIQPDFLVAVGYKWLLGPYGLGYLYASPKWQQEGKPLEYSWLSKKGSENFADLVKYRDDFRPGARRFDMGEFPGFINVPMAIAALTQLNAWGVPAIQTELSKLTKKIVVEAANIGLSFPGENERADHMIGLNLPNGISEDLKDALANEKIYVGFRGKSIRVSPYLYNDENDIKKLTDVIKNHL